MRLAIMGISLTLSGLLTTAAVAETFVELCEAQGETTEICECAEGVLSDEVKSQEMMLYIEVSLLNQMNLDDGIAPQTAWTNAAVEVAAGTGFGVGDVYENSTRIETAHRQAVAGCQN